MVKAITSVTIDPHLLEAAKARGMNISQTLEDALKIYINLDVEDTGDLEASKMQKISELAGIEAKLKEQKHRVVEADSKQVRLKEFDTSVSTNVINSPQALGYWSRETGLSIEELIERKQPRKVKP